MQNNGFPLWSSEEDSRLRHMAAHGHSKFEVAQALGRSVNAVAARATTRRIRFRGQKDLAKDRGGEAPVARRRCLRCRNLFDVPSRFRFVCDLCHALDEWRSADLG
jgi:hypothetical protein